MLLLHTNWSNVPHLLHSYCHAPVLLSMVSIKVNCMVTLQMDKRYYALYNDWCMDSQSHSIKGIGTMHSTTTSTWILNLTFITGRGAMHSTTGTWILTFMIGRGIMHSTTTSTWILNLTFITGRGTMHSTWILNLTFITGRSTMDSTMTGSVTWILNLTFITGRGTMDSTMTNTWILNLTFTTGRGTMDSTMTGSVTISPSAQVQCWAWELRRVDIYLRWGERHSVKHLVKSYWSEPYLHPQIQQSTGYGQKWLQLEQAIQLSWTLAGMTHRSWQHSSKHWMGKQHGSTRNRSVV